MIRFDNSLLFAEGILHELQAIYTPLQLERFQNRLRKFFFPETNAQTDIMTRLHDDPRFDSYPKTRAILLHCLTLNSTQNLNPTQRQHNILSDEEDWTPNPERFHVYEQHYHYFDHDLPQAQIIFARLTDACRRYMIFFEKNHDSEDIHAYHYAYKIMVLFRSPPDPIPFQKIAKWLNTAHDQAHPLHDALLVRFPKIPHLRDLEGWQQLLEKHLQIETLTYWHQGETIEQHHAFKAPQDLNEAKNILHRCLYQRYEEDPVFAEFCLSEHVPESTFNECLNYIQKGWPKKQDDHLPKIHTRGQGEAEGFHWIKVPPTDKRTLVLGYPTGCCQSIDGDSSICVREGASLPNNGFYVLLKEKKHRTKPLIIDGALNLKDFKIVGQSYAWKTMLGNLCLDSLECVDGPEVSIEAQRSILYDFALQVLTQDPSIQSVHVGQGGKTPMNLFPSAKFSEYMLEGSQYHDSIKQYCILRRTVLLDQDMNEAFDLLRMHNPEFFHHYAPYFMPRTNGLFDRIQKIRQEPSYNRTYDTLRSQQSHIVTAIILHTLDMLCEPYLSQIIQHPHSFDILRGLQQLNAYHLLNERDRDLYVSALLTSTQPLQLSFALLILYRTGLLESKRSVILHHPLPYHLAATLQKLHELNLWDEPFVEYLQQHTKLSALDQTLYAFIRLNEHHLWQGEEHAPYRNAILTTQNPDALSKGILILQHTQHLSMYFNLMVRHPYPYEFAQALKKIQEHHIWDDKIVQHLTKCTDLYQLTHSLDAFIALHDFHLLTGHNGSLYIDHICASENPHHLAQAIILLHQNNLLEFLDNVLKSQTPLLYAEICQKLYESHVLTLENITLIMGYPMPQKILKALKTLARTSLWHDSHLLEIVIHALLRHNPTEFADLIKKLDQESLINPFILRHIIHHGSHDLPPDFLNALITLKTIPLDTHDDGLLYHKILTLKHPKQCVNTLKTLYELGLFCHEEGKAIYQQCLEHPKYEEMFEICALLLNQNLWHDHTFIKILLSINDYSTLKDELMNTDITEAFLKTWIEVHLPPVSPYSMK